MRSGLKAKPLPVEGLRDTPWSGTPSARPLAQLCIMVIDQHELVRMGDICGLVPSGQCACDGHRDRLLICVAAVWLATTIRHMAGELDQRGWMDRAHICLMGDHGEDFSDRCFMHHDSVVEGAVHVPIAFTSPDLPICRTDDAIVRTIDILPTLPDLSGIEAPSGLDGTCLNRRMRQKTPLDLVAKGEAFLYRQKDAALDSRGSKSQARPL